MLVKNTDPLGVPEGCIAGFVVKLTADSAELSGVQWKLLTILHVMRVITTVAAWLRLSRMGGHSSI